MDDVEKLVEKIQFDVFDRTGLMMTAGEARIAARATMEHLKAEHSAYGRIEDDAIDWLLKQLEV